MLGDKVNVATKEPDTKLRLKEYVTADSVNISTNDEAVKVESIKCKVSFYLALAMMVSCANVFTLVLETRELPGSLKAM